MPMKGTYCEMKVIRIKDFTVGGGAPFVLIAGPCVIDDAKETADIALSLKELTSRLGIPFIFKASYDKANRSSKDSFRGPGLKKGLDILGCIKDDLNIPILSDVHRFEEIEEASRILDVVQVPAFLCRQTDLLIEVAKRAAVVNVKKGQFIAPWDVRNILAKVTSAGNDNVMMTERGVSFGYNNLVVDMRSLPIIRAMGYPVIFDATHSVQLPGGAGESSGGERDMAVYLARAAVATGVDGIFIEVYPDPEIARCDGPNALYLDSLPGLLESLLHIDAIVKR
jgi:2-dehydro-3-deoxyphosphooctonate aldolase (KDO 8-P synthase)